MADVPGHEIDVMSITADGGIYRLTDKSDVGKTDNSRLLIRVAVDEIAEEVAHAIADDAFSAGKTLQEIAELMRAAGIEIIEKK